MCHLSGSQAGTMGGFASCASAWVSRVRVSLMLGHGSRHEQQRFPWRIALALPGSDTCSCMCC